MITDVNPFIYSHPLSPEDVINRDAETEGLLQNVVGGHFVRLFAPRKYGKTSLLKRALRDGEKHEKLIPVHVDLYRVSSVADVTVRFERAYAKHLKGAQDDAGGDPRGGSPYRASVLRRLELDEGHGAEGAPAPDGPCGDRDGRRPPRGRRSAFRRVDRRINEGVPDEEGAESRGQRRARTHRARAADAR